MSRSLFLLAALLAVPQHTLAQQPDSRTRTLSLVSPQPGREVWLAVRLDPSSTPVGSRAEVVAGSAVVRADGQTRVQTPATIRITTSQPFVLTLATVDPGEELRLVVQQEPLRELWITGDRLVLGRTEEGGAIDLRSARYIEQRAVQPAVPR